MTARKTVPPENSRFEGSKVSALPLTPSEDRQWAMMSHFGAVLGCIPAAIIFAVYRDRGPFTSQESKEAFNFTFPLTILAIVLNVLTLVPGFGWAFAVATVALWVYMTLMGARAAIQANKGRPYRYAFNLRLMK
ncbi:DUF4870 domain-containing protein [Arthrobacter sp. MYb211]|uniref:DUF4870 domain-containing protein n=1 Tax=Micrococcaceae TaxID=1268 RepID=UPI000BB92C5F|nr:MULTISPECIES: DUF4870 domain-containing protein [Micrococcaceae]PCC29115.1 hypothetical protein CIK76_06745 [Glutamicibacter sp. BW80]PRA01135.1 DUF4870 domain-containing protein [Arthrobacter sp. MYb224]PRA13844.1 DUF4870 domain-containing protein [Arthrobacter sp. MYb221]PRC09214.1 DUF4870 domain-containing protein [Arthrobacter sp. MYb211]